MIMTDAYWVVADKTLGTRKPTSTEEIAELQAAGVGGIISLLDDQENLAMYEQHPIDFCWLPVKGGTAPSAEQVDEGAAFAKKIHQQGKAIAVHCTGGKKRTGTLIAALLVQSGHSADDALAALHTANPTIALSEGQISLLRELTPKT